MATAYLHSDELWKECATWLTHLGVLRNDHRVNFLNATIVDLANTLRDGVVLCILINTLDPNCIDMKEVNRRPVLAQFLCLKNIGLFLERCTSTFGLKAADLFEPLMLFDLTNFYKVLYTLSKLSLTPKALKTAPGFSAQSNKATEEDDIYQSLKSVDLKTSSTSSVEPSWLQFTIPCPQPEDREEEVYDNLCYVTFSACLPEFACISLFLCVREPPNRNSVISNDLKHYDIDYNHREDIYQDLCDLQHGISHSELVDTQPEKRDFVIRELVETEKNYVDVLTKLKKNFMLPLQQYLKSEVHAVVFCKINELYDIHTKFLTQLLKVYTDRSCRLSKIFMQFRESFLVYGSYCANLNQACSNLQDICCKDEEINDAVIKMEKEVNNGKFKLRDVLSVPMQRILKYHLLLDNLIKSTDPNHEEFNDLKRAREAMLDVAGYINETARDVEHLNMISSLKRDIINWSHPIELERLGRLLKDGEIKVKAHSDNKAKTRYVFIFDKCMIICKHMKNQFAYREMLLLHEYRVDEYHNRPLLNQNTRWNYTFHLVKYDQSIAYTFYVRTIELKIKIIKALKDAMDNIKPSTKTSHKLDMYMFLEPTTCNKCSKYLKGCIYQGYKCSVCDINVHKECISTSGKCVISPVSQNIPPPSTPSKIIDKLWYAGELNRDTATSILQKRRNGTFLVRYRPSAQEEDRFALSLKTGDAVKHMKIRSNINGSEIKYYLSLSKYFNSIEELIENYHHYSLKENFERLEEHTKLEWPYKIIIAEVLKDFEPQDSCHLHLYTRQQVTVIDLNGYRDGWWKGKTENGIGYFPKDFVKVIERCFIDDF